MPWGWSTRGQMPTELGGSRGSVQESKVAHAWPKYEADYLKSRLETDLNPDSKYYVGNVPNDMAARTAFLNKVTENYKQEADECLHDEFTQWLQGIGEYHEETNIYENKIGEPIRRHIYRTDLPNDGKTQIGDPMAMEDTQWDPTWWKKEQLTHLPGVRDYLRANAVKGKQNEFAMNLLAEHGPQNLEEAWMYFKHWVKKRPISDSDCIDQELTEYMQRNEDEIKRATGNLNHHMGPRPYMGPKSKVNVPNMGSASLAGATAAGLATAGLNPVLQTAAAAAAASYFTPPTAKPQTDATTSFVPLVRSRSNWFDFGDTGSELGAVIEPVYTVPLFPSRPPSDRDDEFEIPQEFSDEEEVSPESTLGFSSIGSLEAEEAFSQGYNEEEEERRRVRLAVTPSTPYIPYDPRSTPMSNRSTLPISNLQNRAKSKESPQSRATAFIGRVDRLKSEHGTPEST